jgi:hypothetical protein
MTGYRFAVDGMPPKLGEHNDEVFAQWLDHARPSRATG